VLTLAGIPSRIQKPRSTTLNYGPFNVQNYSYDYTRGACALLNYGSANLTNLEAGG